VLRGLADLAENVPEFRTSDEDGSSSSGSSWPSDDSSSSSEDGHADEEILGVDN